MAVKLTDEQMQIVKGMAKICGNFADQLLHIIRNHGLDKVNGCYIGLDVDPHFHYCTESVVFGKAHSDAGFVRLAKGEEEDEFTPTGKNSAEYELLFADEAIRSTMAEVLGAEKPLPPDGLWVGDDRNSAPVDSRGHEMRFDDVFPWTATNEVSE